ncbi:RecQ family ATP-dependent DNA helicase [Algoriphagus namhaensis]|uniref:ATP-dependent DNA helicase RecQ n=1 Tax=Algoriphagus namhaensis TaxID=915353 RepID=A0ABV8AQI8_9BACT
MGASPRHILKQVFGFDGFRPLQEEIIASVLSGNDTLALLPTGAGKSLCYQIPGLAMEGICLVVSPLIALMKDQVDGLHAKGIKAHAVYSGMHKREVDRTLDNSIYGDYKFLFVSPERLKSELFIERFKQMNVAMIVVDEAHCISQWGYDFRPQYLEIASIREFHPKVPVLALTATATPKVAEDIQVKLEMKNQAVFTSTFARANLSFSVRLVENMLEKGVEVLSRIPGSAIWYVRSRQMTHQISKSLAQLGFTAGAYHAGIPVKERDLVQKKWMDGLVRVMVCTNAFGMGIDKSDVRIVLHSDLPENLESYYQEAGRAGRDGKKSFAVLMSNEQDFEKLMNRAALVYPPIDFVKRVYQCLANHFQLAVGSKVNESLDFDWGNFARIYNLGVLEAFYGLKVLEEEGFIAMSESYYSPSRVHFLVESHALYQIQIAYVKLDPVIKILLRTYGGNLFAEYIKINEAALAKALSISEEELIRRLNQLDEMDLLDYDKRKDKPQIFFLTPRYDAGRLPLNISRINERRAQTLENAQVILKYAHQQELCRMEFVQQYFGEKETQPCGFCDICLKRKKNENPIRSENKFKSRILKTLEESGELTKEELLAKINSPNSTEAFDIIREMIDLAELIELPGGKIKING